MWGCRCGNCQPGGKEMTLAEEKELDLVRSGLTYVTGGDKHCKDPHWHSKYPWKENPATMPNNKRAVEATFLRTERQLSKEPDWKSAYATQVHEMVNRRAAMKLPLEALKSWTGPVWYISHLIAPNPHSVSTPVRLVWNSSQKYKGLSLNDMLIKGPDVLNPIRAVLLRFRAGVYAALGDIRKMYNSVWLEDQEVHLHRFLWRDSEDQAIEDYAITRVNIGDKPAGCIAQVAMRETANLPQFRHFTAERRVVEEDAYVDDILTSHNDLVQLKTLTSNVEEILKAGGFHMKPWVYSGQSGRAKAKIMNIGPTMILPNQLTEDDNKALGLGYTVDSDKLHVMRGRHQALEEYTELSNVKFTRPLTPSNLLERPSGITFSDGSEHAYGAVLYLRWICSEGVVIRLVEAKAKLTPLDHKGDPVKAEMCGAVFAARLKNYFQRHCRIEVGRWYHFVDSQTILGAIQRESYGYKTFFANRIGEIQNSTDVNDWRWIPGQSNVADTITRGASPQDLMEDSEWQSGPKFLSLPENEWPTMSAKDVAAQARENLIKIQKKAFSAALTKEDQVKQQAQSSRRLTGEVVQKLVDVKRFSTLLKLVKTVAWIWRAVEKFLSVNALDKAKWEAVPSGVITATEREDAFRDICLAAQDGVCFPETTTDRLVVYRDTTGLLVCGGRIQSFKKEGKAVPLLPYCAWVSTLLAREAHCEAHDGIAGTVLRMRKKAKLLTSLSKVYFSERAPKENLVRPRHKFHRCKAVLTDLYSFLEKQDKVMLEEMAVRNGTSWSWRILPADSPHRNGAAEAAVRITKKALQSLGGGTNLTYSEFATVLQVAANLANERPIDAQVQSHEGCVQYISPNSLLLGRASQTGDLQTFDFENYPYKRLREIQTQVKSFWKSWCQLAGPNLFVRSKWHTAERNVAVGDIVWLCDQNALRGQFKLASVISVNPDPKGVVRDVRVRVSLSNCAPMQTTKSKDKEDKIQHTILHRDVRRLVVLIPIEEQQ
ncbi:hypothetical protein WMY93_025355 [Mugilogobius chulae]|uniref:DUF5641 domain-containing protein n=1 Tax=Mugilogobius chulae TaxID=88201 RepID=A0AAW0N294_9GOBI